ncbi:hypothetical protein BB8028_0002g03010 [Beauveria bassiana]|uniref:Mitochondrial distribution and morphology protein 12 n=1 Tax=Beauveria bassiana TaxID=176275 RepID=A0A2S7Y1E0_BEABA|nr:hypothetical protein BB8028_0002g03010 [Beauveria bassiana]
MSIDLNWETLTSGPDGEALAERIRGFIHDKFQSVPLPRFIKSVTVHGFDFGSIPPELELKDITDPLPDFYEQELEDDESDDDEADEEESGGEHSATPHHHHHHHNDIHNGASRQQQQQQQQQQQRRRRTGRNRPADLKTAIKKEFSLHHHDLASPFMGTSTPGLLGGPALSYLHGHLGTGTQTPLAAVAGAQLGNSWLGHGYDSASDAEAAATAAAATATAAATAAARMAPYHHSRNPSQSSISEDNFPSSYNPPPPPPPPLSHLPAAASPLHRDLREKSSVSTLAPTSIGTSRPPTRDTHAVADSAIADSDDEGGDDGDRSAPLPANLAPRRREPRAEDVQAVFRIQYAGDIRLNLTAEILLDYPMPSFVGIPLKLNITGMSFDGVGVLAHIRKRVHFCFLSPDDALTAVGRPEEDGGGGGGGGGGSGRPGSSGQAAEAESGPRGTNARFGGLLQEIKVESEIGGREGGKQSLKNVGKVEKFVLEQVRRIFEEEFVYPSFWTFLV